MNASDLRPISITCTIAKILQNAAYQQALNHLISNDLIDPFQSGFRPAHSTTTALVDVFDNIKGATDNGLLTIMFYLIFTQAFPSIVHDDSFSKNVLPRLL